MDTYSYIVADKSTYESIDYEAFSDEAYEKSHSLYDGIVENEAVSQDYLDKNLPVAYEQLVLGGYRLFYTIKYMFGDDDTADGEMPLPPFEQALIPTRDQSDEDDEPAEEQPVEFL